MKNKLFSNTGTLTKFIFKRERINTTIWIVGIVAITLIVAAVLPTLFNSDAERQAMAETMQNPAMVAMLGPAYGVDNYNNGAMMSQMMLLFTIIGVVVMNVFLVVRSTRKDEEDGHIEVIRSLPVGRLSNLSATMIVSVIANIIVAVLVGFGLYVLHIENMDLPGSLMYGTVLGVSGILFAGITALFCQLTATSRGAYGYSFAFLGLMYLIQAGSASSPALSYISLLSLAMKAQVYVSNFIWPIFVVLILAIIFLAIAFRLNQTRDLGEGIIPARAGRKNASKFLQSSFGLSARLVRGAIIGWIICLLLLGVSYGSVMGDLQTFIGSNDFFKQMLDAGAGIPLVEQFITMILSMMSIVACIPAVMVLLKLRGEEKKGRNESILARSVSKTKLLGGYFIISIITSCVMIFSVTFGLWASAYASMSDPLAFSTVLKAGFVYLPALWVMISIALLLIDFLPRLTSIIWIYLGCSFFIVYLGKIMKFPEWIAKLTPFGYVPQVPVQEMNVTSLVVLTAIAIVVSAIGFVKFSRREMVS